MHGARNTGNAGSASSVNGRTRRLAFGLIALAMLNAYCGSPSAEKDETPPQAPDPTPPDVILYVTFSGESGKPGVTEPINNVYGIAADGSYQNTKDLLDASGVALDELRGMALSPDGTRLFIANANKRHNQILVFGPLIDSPGATTYVSTFASPETADATGLLHPYQPALDDEGNLYVSSQDTFVVTSFASSGSDAPTGSVRATPSWWTENYADSNLYPGTWAPADEASEAATPPPTPAPIKSSVGGLKGPRGIAVSSLMNRLYVADSPDKSVKSYELTTGKYLGKVVEFETGEPVGLAFDEPDGRLFVTAEKSDDVHVVDVGSPASPCDSGCPEAKIIDSSEGDAVLDAPSGIVVVSDFSSDTATIYVASRLGLRINKYAYDFTAGALTASETFAKDFTDTPEQLIAAP
jgi:DNA-binding beta-propeller fold protein YncE